MEERVTRPVTSSGNVSGVNAVRTLQGTSVKLVRMQSIVPIRSRGGSRGRVHGVRGRGGGGGGGGGGGVFGGGGRGGAPPPPPPPRDDLRFSNTTSIQQKKPMWFIGVELEQETSAPPPPPKKSPGSAPEDCRGRWIGALELDIHVDFKD